eukprot:2727472-Amphidinium_carterae.1
MARCSDTKVYSGHSNRNFKHTKTLIRSFKGYRMLRLTRACFRLLCTTGRAEKFLQHCIASSADILISDVWALAALIVLAAESGVQPGLWFRVQ